MHVTGKVSPSVDSAVTYPIFKSFLAGSVSGTCSTLLLQPLDLVKTRIQSTPKSYASVGMVTIYREVLRNENVVGLWKGLTPSLLRCVPGVGLYFGALHGIQSHFGSGKPGKAELLAMGGGARCISGVTLLPFTVVKCRFESGQFHYGSVSNAFRTIYSMEGTRGLYSGMLVTLVRDVPFSGLYLLFYTNAKDIVRADDASEFWRSIELFLCGVAAGTMASVVTQPADVIKTHMQTRTTSFSSAVKHIISNYGARGLMSGVVPRVLRRTMMAALTWTLYEHVTKQLGLH